MLRAPQLSQGRETASMDGLFYPWPDMRREPLINGSSTTNSRISDPRFGGVFCARCWDILLSLFHNFPLVIFDKDCAER